MNETSVTVVGNIGSEVTQRRAGVDGTLVVGFRVISSARRRDRLTGEWVDGDRFSARVSCWRRLGEHVLTTLVKGDPVVVHGRVSIREYEAEGERRFSTEITASSVGPDLARCRAQVARRPSEEVERAEAAATGAPGIDGADEADGVAPASLPGAAGPGDWAVGLLDQRGGLADGPVDVLDVDPWAAPLRDPDGSGHARSERSDDTVGPAADAA